MINLLWDKLQSITRSLLHHFLALIPSSSLFITLILITVPTLVIALYFLQSRLIYIPQFPPGSKTVVWKPDRFGFRKWKEDQVLSKDGTKLHIYWIEGEGTGVEEYPTILFFHVKQNISLVG
jgi:hypothetical protein